LALPEARDHSEGGGVETIEQGRTSEGGRSDLRCRASVRKPMLLAEVAIGAGVGLLAAAYAGAEPSVGGSPRGLDGARRRPRLDDNLFRPWLKSQRGTRFARAETHDVAGSMLFVWPGFRFAFGRNRACSFRPSPSSWQFRCWERRSARPSGNLSEGPLARYSAWRHL